MSNIKMSLLIFYAGCGISMMEHLLIFSIAARQVLNDKDPNRWIGRGGPVPWPPTSPDFTPLDFFLWGPMKSLVYDTPGESEQSLIARILLAAGDTSDNPRMVARVHRSLFNR